MSSSNAALAASAESEAAREWKRQAAEARRAEAKAMASQQRAEVAAQNARKEIGQKRPKLQVEPVEPVEPEKKRRRDEFKRRWVNPLTLTKLLKDVFKRRANLLTKWFAEPRSRVPWQSRK